MTIRWLSNHEKITAEYLQDRYVYHDGELYYKYAVGCMRQGDLVGTQLGTRAEAIESYDKAHKKLMNGDGK
jgi:hypothetical protein